MEQSDHQSLRAGAGRAEIRLPAELFPLEGFSGVHDPLHVRALLLESGTKVALVSVELTSMHHEQVAMLREIVAEAADLPAGNAWICVTHTFSAPHARPGHHCRTAEEQGKNALLWEALESATRAAVSQAAAGLREARFGHETGVCDVNVNRDVPTGEGWWLGASETGPSDKSVTVLRFESTQGDPIALLYSYGVQSSVMDVPPWEGRGGRLVTGDLAGAASGFVEREYGDGVTALFLLGAAGDQAPALRGAWAQYVGKDGRSRVKEGDERGFIVAEMLGARLGTEVLRIAERTACTTWSDSIMVREWAVGCPGQETTATQSLRPVTEYAFVPAPERTEPVGILLLGDVALVGMRPELNSETATCIREQSPFPETMVVTMVNGGAKYMPDRGAYDRITYEAMSSPFAQGSAELLSQKVVELLRSMRH